MSDAEKIAAALAFLNGETERVTPCSKHPEGHSFKVGEQHAEDLAHIFAILNGGPR